MKKILVIILILLSYNNYANFQSNEKMKAIFIYNFMKYIEWPSEKKEGPFVIGIKESPELFEEMVLITKIKKVYGNQQVVVKNIDDVNEECHLLYLGKSFKGSLLSIVEKTKQNNTLLISDIAGSINKGICIELIISGSQAEFDINKRNLKERKLTVSQQLLDIARNIE